MTEEKTPVANYLLTKIEMGSEISDLNSCRILARLLLRPEDFELTSNFFKQLTSNFFKHYNPISANGQLTGFLWSK